MAGGFDSGFNSGFNILTYIFRRTLGFFGAAFGKRQVMGD